MYIVDVDDFHEDNHCLDIFESLRAKYPEFKATVFTVVGMCSIRWLETIKRDYPWLDMVPHGLFHRDAYECARWDLAESVRYLRYLEPLELTHGFKAPGWQISDAMYTALNLFGYWVADQEYNNARRPVGLRAYLLDSGNKLHFHVQNVCNNGLQESMPLLMSLNPSEGFGFIKDVI